MAWARRERVTEAWADLVISLDILKFPGGRVCWIVADGKIREDRDYRQGLVVVRGGRRCPSLQEPALWGKWIREVMGCIFHRLDRGTRPPPRLNMKPKMAALSPVRVLSLGLIVAMAPPLSSCGRGDSAGATDDRAIKVGAVFDLTGPTADVGTDYADGMRDFVDWTNGQGGIEGYPIDLMYQDYAYQVDRAEQLYRQFASEGAVAFMGWGTGDTEALRPFIAADEIPFSSASLSHVLGDPGEAPYNFLLATSYSDQFRIALDWIARHHGEGTPVVALMHNASPFGTSPARLGGTEFAQARGIDLSLHEMPRGAVDYTAEFSRIRQSGAQYVVFQNTSGPAAVALRNAASLGVDASFICLNWCANELLVRLAGDASEGTLGTIPYVPLSVDVPGTRIIREYLEAKGESSEGKTNAYTQGWWTFAVFAEAMRRVLVAGDELTGANIKASLETFTAFDMREVTAPLTFTPTDHRGSKGLRIFRVEGGKWVPITEYIAAPGTR